MLTRWFDEKYYPLCLMSLAHSLLFFGSFIYNVHTMVAQAFYFLDKLDIVERTRTRS